MMTEDFGIYGKCLAKIGCFLIYAKLIRFFGSSSNICLKRFYMS